MIALLDACLKDGYNSKSVASVSRTGTTATFTFATAHGYAADGLTTIVSSGWTEAVFNGEFRANNVAALSFTVTVPDSGATTGTGVGITKVAPLGWAKAFAGTNKAAYRANDLTGNRLFLRVDDNNPNTDSYKTAMWRGYEAMTDVDSGTGLSPTALQHANGLFASKSTTADVTTRKWVVIGDGFEFYLCVANHNSYLNNYEILHFGDFIPEAPTDPYGCLIIAGTLASTSFPAAANQLMNISNAVAAQSGHFVARSFTQVGSATPVGKCGMYALGGALIGGGQLNYPTQNSNSLYISDIKLVEGVSGIRGKLGGFYAPLHDKPFGHGGIVPANVSPISRTLFAVTATQSSAVGEALFDVDGPWR
jgi:hypothetical protein